MQSIVPMIDCTPQRCWTGSNAPRLIAANGMASVRPSVSVSKALEHDVKELRRTNEILKTASVFFAQAQPDRKLKS